MKKINPHVSMLFRIGDSFLNSRLEGTGMTSSTANFLHGLLYHDKIRLSDLSEEVGVDNAHTSRVIAALEKKGMITRKPDPVDGRACLVSLTDRGHSAALTIKEAMAEWIEIVTKGISRKDISEVNRVLDLFYENAKDYLTGRGRKNNSILIPDPDQKK